MRTDHKPSFSLGVLAGSRHHFVQLAARLGIRLHLPIPIVVRPGMKQRLQLATLLRRELLNRPLDFSNRAHGTKLSGMHYGVNSRPCPDPTPRLLQAQSTLNSQPSTINTMLACPPRKAPLPASISAFSFQRFSFSLGALNQSNGLFSVAPALRPPASTSRETSRAR